jgi:chemotaxis protein methyltransferase CheR
MVDAITTNFTSFFREKQHFDFLVNKILPKIVQAKDSRFLRIRGWCAAASSGEEPYTLALTLLEFFQGRPGIDMKLLATDVSTKALAKAVQGAYSVEKVKTVPTAILARYFDQVREGKEDFFWIKKEVKDLITFRRLNLMDAVFPFKGPLDFIFCRNVMIYFDSSTQVVLADKLLKLLSPGGYLFTGHSENLPAVLRTRVDAVAPAIYRKVA